jgi:hypothetical protein
MTREELYCLREVGSRVCSIRLEEESLSLVESRRRVVLTRLEKSVWSLFENFEIRLKKKGY